jgi:hypothetical protein
VYTAFPSPIRATCPANHILLDLITRTILGKQYRALSSSLCSIGTYKTDYTDAFKTYHTMTVYITVFLKMNPRVWII